ncbi:MAG: carbohydrate ABC transporter permease [Acidimicrobiales bacterium]
MAEPDTDGLLTVAQWAFTGAVLWGAGLLVLTKSESWIIRPFMGVLLIAATWFILTRPDSFDRVASTMLVVVFAVGLIGSVWVAANLVLNTAPKNWAVFSSLTAATVAAIGFAILRGNLAIRALITDQDPIYLGAGSGWPGRLEWPIFGALVWGVGVFAMSVLPSRIPRIAVGVGLGAITGWFIGAKTQLWQRPDFSVLEAILWSVGIAALFAAPAFKRNWVPSAIVGAAVGWTVSVWLVSPFLGTENQGKVAAIVPLALIGVRLGWNDRPTSRTLSRFDNRGRAVLFLGPALLFLFAALVIPGIRTFWLSFKNRRSTENVGLRNYRELWNDADSFDFSRWTDMFGSQLFTVAVVLALVGITAGIIRGIKLNGEASFERTGASVASLSAAAFLLAYAALSVIRGTFFNNIWWVVTVTSLSVVLGMTIAVLAEKDERFESFAKSLIFMPMAVSFVGASIVWRLQYQPRAVTKPQTGVLNAGWVTLGELSHSGWPRWLGIVVLALLVAFFLQKAVARGRAGKTFGVFIVGIVVAGHLLIELARRSLGGFQISESGEITPDTVVFLQEAPFNNVFMMVILIWIQTGFAMVILSAAIKAVPTEFIEAARVDGANESQTFFKVILPQILPTVGVITTTLIVLVTKVFDIVKVSTGGNFGTNVLANDMVEESFSFFNVGKGSAIAMLILFSVLPVMISNVWKMQRDRMAHG